MSLQGLSLRYFQSMIKTALDPAGDDCITFI
jgi:hypothetical protein